MTLVVPVNWWPRDADVETIIADVAPQLADMWVAEGLTVWETPLHVMFHRPGEIGPNQQEMERRHADAEKMIAGTENVALAVTLTDDPLMQYVVGELQIEVDGGDSD